MAERNEKTAGGEPAAAGAVTEATQLDYPHYNRFPPSCQSPTIQDLERKAAYHRNRTARFATLADIAWRFGDAVNRRKMQRAQLIEARLAFAIRRVLLDAGGANE